MPRGTGRPVGRVVASALLSSVVAVGSLLLAPVAHADAGLRLSPGHGTAGTTRVTVDGTGFGACQPDTKNVQLRWDDGADLGTPSIRPDGSISTSFTVPANARPAPHRVTATCRAYPGPNLKAPDTQNFRGPFDVTVAATFTVDPAPPGVLTLDPASGAAGTTFRARGTGFSCPAGEPVVLRWEQRELGRVQAPGGTFDQQVTAAADAPPGAHPVEAACDPSADHDTTATFTVDQGGSVTPTPTPGPTPTPDPSDGPVLRVEPGAASAGQQVALTGTGFACRGAEAELTWNGVVWEHASTGPGDGFVVTTRIADDARPGHYRLRAVCPDRPEMAGSTDFEVLAAHVVPDPGGGDAAPTALVVGSTAGGAAVLAALAGTYVLGRRRGPHWASAHVAVTPVAGAPPRPLVTETDDPAGPGRTVRLESREDPGTQRVEETPGVGPTGGQVSAGETGAEEGGTTEEEP
ncbi:hypothetical protein ACW14Y_06565 [Kitasatospora sp. cg17-2]